MCVRIRADDLPAVDLQRDFNARLLAAWDGGLVGGQSFGSLRRNGAELEVASEEDRRVADMLRERASRVNECAWLAEPSRSPAAPLKRQLTRQSSTPNRFWAASASGGSSRLAPPPSTVPKIARQESAPPSLL